MAILPGARRLGHVRFSTSFPAWKIAQTQGWRTLTVTDSVSGSSVSLTLQAGNPTYCPMSVTATVNTTQMTGVDRLMLGIRQRFAYGEVLADQLSTTCAACLSRGGMVRAQGSPARTVGSPR